MAHTQRNEHAPLDATTLWSAAGLRMSVAPGHKEEPLQNLHWRTLSKHGAGARRACGLSATKIIEEDGENDEPSDLSSHGPGTMVSDDHSSSCSGATCARSITSDGCPTPRAGTLHDAIEATRGLFARLLKLRHRRLRHRGTEGSGGGGSSYSSSEHSAPCSMAQRREVSGPPPRSGDESPCSKQPQRLRGSSWPGLGKANVSPATSSPGVTQEPARRHNLVVPIPPSDVKCAMAALKAGCEIYDGVWGNGSSSDRGRDALLQVAGPLYHEAMYAASHIQHAALRGLVQQAVRCYVNPYAGRPDDVLRVILELLASCGSMGPAHGLPRLATPPASSTAKTAAANMALCAVASSPSACGDLSRQAACGARSCGSTSSCGSASCCPADSSFASSRPCSSGSVPSPRSSAGSVSSTVQRQDSVHRSSLAEMEAGPSS